MKILEVRHLKKYFVKGGKKVTVIDDINFSVDAGECLGIVGLSGCGKSTTARIVAKLLNSDGGEIFFCGENVTTTTDLKKFYAQVQMIFQTPDDSFDPRKSLGWSIAEPLKNYGCKNISAKVSSLLAEVDLPAEYAERYPHEVSGGECQRAAIARAISLSPKLLISDEATSALDADNQIKIVALIKNLCHKKNIACLFITHDLALLPHIADNVLVMDGGKIAECGKPLEILRQPKSEIARRMLAANFF
ncbi:MAG: ABC transporter ATP-binding protein [Selenomonadaceae bacterium]|nr:ABC transporter ATP-binding protein [Selenomonadaceae bacterium]